MISSSSTKNISANMFQNMIIMLQYIGFLLIIVLFFITIYFKKYIKERYLWIMKLNNVIKNNRNNRNNRNNNNNNNNNEKDKYDEMHIISDFEMVNV